MDTTHVYSILGADFSIAELFPSWKSWEFFGFVTGILSVLLLIPTKRPRLQYTNWYFSMASAAVYFFLFKEWILYGNMALQVPFFIISAIGAVIWFPQFIGRDLKIPYLTKLREIPTTFATFSHWTGALVYGILAIIIAYPLLNHYHDASPLWDGLIFTISIAAIYLQLRKYAQNWYLWILVDMIAVPFHLSQNRGATALLYLVYGIMCYFGLKTWNEEAEDHRDMMYQQILDEIAHEIGFEEQYA